MRFTLLTWTLRRAAACLAVSNWGALSLTGYTLAHLFKYLAALSETPPRRSHVRESGAGR
jgi:hypothetical protein